jgi:hypothetical protein
MLHDFWSGLVPNTHDNTRLYVATIELMKVIGMLRSYLDSLIGESLRKKLARQGNSFESYVQTQLKDKAKREHETERIAMETLGACNRCSKALAKTHIQEKLCQFVGEKLFCKDCWSQMYSDGSISELYKKKSGNGKNGNA